MTRLWASGVLCVNDSSWYWLTGAKVRMDMWATGQPDGPPAYRVVIWDYEIEDQRQWLRYQCLCEHGKAYDRKQILEISLGLRTW